MGRILAARHFYHFSSDVSSGHIGLRFCHGILLVIQRTQKAGHAALKDS